MEYIVERANEQGETGLSYSMNRFKTPENLCGKDTQENDHRGLGPNTWIHITKEKKSKTYKQFWLTSFLKK